MPVAWSVDVCAKAAKSMNGCTYDAVIVNTSPQTLFYHVFLFPCLVFFTYLFRLLRMCFIFTPGFSTCFFDFVIQDGRYQFGAAGCSSE